MKKIIIYATSKEGNGYVTEIGKVDEIEYITIRCGMFAPDVVISFKVEVKEETN